MRASPLRLFFFLFISVLLVSAPPVAVAAVWYVDGQLGTDPSDCSAGQSWTDAYLTIQKAIDCAVSNDEIWVKMGTYALESTIEVDKSVAIYGGFAGSETQRSQRNWETYVTTIDGQGSFIFTDTRRCLSISADATIDGLTITNGYAEIVGGGIWIYSSSPTIANCIISQNYAFGPTGSGGGGGIYVESSSPTISNCIFLENRTVDIGGGAIYNDLNSSVTVVDCVFTGNETGHQEGFGGGIYNRLSSSADITNCIFSGNVAGFGGGVLNEGSCTITNSTFSGNIGIWVGGAIANTAFTTSSLTIVNSILWNDISGTGADPEINNLYSYFPPNISYSDIKGSNGSGAGWDINLGTDYGGNIDADPLFVDPDNGDFRLQEGSPCIDAAAEEDAPDTDFDGNTRPQGLGYDIGAYEFVHEITIDYILDFFDQSVQDETLYGIGKKPLIAKINLWLMRATLQAPQKLIEHNRTKLACVKLKLAYLLTDGKNKPSDLVAGEACDELNAMIAQLMADMGCK